MATDIRRDESFRTAIKNQKRRLSATKLPSFNIERRKSSVVHDPLNPVCLEIIAPDSDNNGRRKESRSGSLPDIQVLKFNRIRKCGSNGSSPELARRQAEEEDADAENKIPENEVAKTPSRSSSPLLHPRRSRAPGAHAQSHSQSQSPSPSRPLQTTPHSPFAPKRPSPLVLPKNNLNTEAALRPTTPDSPSLLRAAMSSPVPPDSPLLSRDATAPESPMVKRARELRRAGSFRRSLERSRERSKTRAGSAARDKEGQEDEREEEVSFCIRRHLGNKQGWKIMPESTTTPMKPEAIRRVVGMIKEMELSGHQIPERITIMV